MSELILVTGATGFVGSHFVDYVLKEKPNTEIICTKRWHHSRLINVEHFIDKVSFHDCDLTEYISVKQMIEKYKPTRIFHFAAESFVSPSWAHPQLYMNQNYGATLNLLNAIREVGIDARILIPGSGEEYGEVKKEDLPITIKTPLNPVNPYAVSKIAQDLIGYTYFKSFGTGVIRTRAFNHEGPRRDRVFGLPSYAYQLSLIKKGYRSEKTVYTGERDDERYFTHVKDMVEAYWLAVEMCEPGELYLLGSVSNSDVTTFRQALEHLVVLSGLENVDFEQIKKYKRPTAVPYLIFNDDRFNKLTGWSPKIGLKEILLDTLNYWDDREDLRGLDNGSY